MNDVSTINPYDPSQTKPASSDSKEVERRDLVMVVLLSVVTLFIGYPIYLCYLWAKELNGLAGQTRHLPTTVVLVSIVTLGIAAIVYECLFAFEIAGHMKRLGRKDALPELGVWVTALNVTAIIASFTFIGIVIAIPAGMAATCLLQAEFNKLAAKA